MMGTSVTVSHAGIFEKTTERSMKGMSKNNSQAWEKIQAQQSQQKGPQNPQQQQHQQQKGEAKKEKRPNFFVYNGRIALRFYTRLLQEAVLALMLAAPVWLVLKALRLDEITLTVDLPTFWGIAFVAFILQSFMFGKA